MSRDMRSHFGLEKLSNLPIKIRNVDLEVGGPVLRERTAACAQAIRKESRQTSRAARNFAFRKNEQNTAARARRDELCAVMLQQPAELPGRLCCSTTVDLFSSK